MNEFQEGNDLFLAFYDNVIDRSSDKYIHYNGTEFTYARAYAIIYGIMNAVKAAGNGKVEVTADKITAEYAANEADASGRYAGKTLEVTGKVASVARHSGLLTIVLQGHEAESFVSGVNFTDDRTVERRVKVGQTVTFRSDTVQYLDAIHTVMMSDCVFVR